MSLGAAFGIGCGVGFAAAVAGVLLSLSPLKPPGLWREATRLALYFLPGAGVGALRASLTAGLLVWVGSVVVGMASVVALEPLRTVLQRRLGVLPARNAALSDLIRAETEEGFEAVRERLDSPFQPVRSYAASRIRRRDWRQGLPDLLRRLEVEEDAEVRNAITLALADWADPTTRASLVGLLDDEDESVRRLALRGLSRLGDPGVPVAARRMYETTRWMNRIEAVGALIELRTPEGDATLHELMANEQSWRRRRQARAAMRRLRKRRARDAVT